MRDNSVSKTRLAILLREIIIVIIIMLIIIIIITTIIITVIVIIKMIIGEVDIRRGIFQNDSLSSLFFVLCMVPLAWFLRRAKAGYEWGNKRSKLNHLLFMDDLKFFAKSKNQIDPMVQTVDILSEDIGMQFGIKKCGVLIMERVKVIRTDGIRLPDGQHMEDIDETGYTYLAILETDKIKEKEMKEKFSREYLRRLRLILRSKLNGRNKIMAVNTWAASVMGYGAGILKWNTDELKTQTEGPERL